MTDGGLSLAELFADLRANQLTLVSCRLVGGRVASFTCAPSVDEPAAPVSRSEETTQPETHDALERFLRRKEPRE